MAAGDSSSYCLRWNGGQILKEDINLKAWSLKTNWCHSEKLQTVVRYPSLSTHQSRAWCARGWGTGRPSTVAPTDPNDGVFHHQRFHSFIIHLHPGTPLGGILKLHKDLQNNIKNWDYCHWKDDWKNFFGIHCQVSYFKLCSIVLLLLKEVSRERSKICMDIVMQIILIMGGHTFTKLLNISNVIKHLVNCDVFTQQIRQKI